MPIMEHEHQWGGSIMDATILPDTTVITLGLKPGSSLDRVCTIIGCDASFIGDPNPEILEGKIVDKNLLPQNTLKSFSDL